MNTFEGFNKPTIYIFDIDGTVADCTHRLHYIYPENGKEKDWDTFHAESVNDTTIDSVATIAHCLFQAGHGIVFVTARNDVSRKITEEWLETKLLIPASEFKLFMRADGDRRPDFEIKKDIFEAWPKHIQERVQCIFEDRANVVEMWRSLGLRCLQVEEGDY